MGYSPYGMEEKWSPAPDVKAEALTRQKQGQWQRDREQRGRRHAGAEGAV